MQLPKILLSKTITSLEESVEYLIRLDDEFGDILEIKDTLSDIILSIDHIIEELEELNK
jgi:ribosome-associated translation inhibitor RaiA